MFNKKKPVARVTIDQFSSLISGNLSLVGDVTFEEGGIGIMYISITYTIRGTNDPRNLVFPFYTLPAEE